MIHGHDHTPFLEHQGFSIRPGTETTIGIREVGRPQPSHFPLSTQPWGLRDTGTEAWPSPQDEVHRLGSPYGHCTKGVEGVDVQLLYKASYTLQVSLGPWRGEREHLGRGRGSQERGWSGEGDLESGVGPGRGKPG